MPISDLTDTLASILLERKLTLVTAESCTGGSIAAALTDLPGSSEWFAGGLVTYSNEMKTRLLKVREETLERYGAVSPQTAQAMVAGAIETTGADIAVSATGIAGPGGGSDEKPVGLVYTGYAIKGGDPFSLRHDFSGDRQKIRRDTVEASLENLIKLLEDLVYLA